MVALFALMFLLQYNLPKKFQWNATYYHADRQPFGCYVFDSVLSQSMPRSYQVTSKTFLQLDLEHPKEKIGVLVIVDRQDLHKLDVKHLCEIAKRGGKVMIVAGSTAVEGGMIVVDGVEERVGELFKNELERTFKISIWSHSSFSLNYILSRDLSNTARYLDTICWKGKSQVYPPHEYVVWDGLATGYLNLDSVRSKSPLAYYKSNGRVEENRIVAATLPYGKGEVIFVVTPLLFTNYGILEGNTSEYIFRLMSQMADVPIYRTEAYMETEAMRNAQSSPLRELIKRPPLRWAIYLTMLGILLFMITTARRRQRVIPVVTKPGNKSLEFIRLIGTLYYQRCSHVELVQKKFLFFTEELRRRTGIEISEVNTDDRDVKLLSLKTGLDEAYVLQTLREIRLTIHSEIDIEASEMRRLIDAMNEMLQRI